MSFVGTLTGGFIGHMQGGIEGFYQSAEYKRVENILPFCRLWCLVEIAATILSEGKGLVFVGARVEQVEQHPRRCVLLEGATNDMISFMENCAWIIDAGRAACALESDRKREMATIENSIVGGVKNVNKIIASAIRAGRWHFLMMVDVLIRPPYPPQPVPSTYVPSNPPQHPQPLLSLSPLLILKISRAS